MCAECQLVTRNAALFLPGGDPSSGVKLEVGANAGQLKATMDMRALDAEYVGREPRANSVPFTVEIFTSSSGESNNHKLCGAGGVEHKLSRLRVACIPGMPVFRGLKDGEELLNDIRTLWPGPGGQMGVYLSALRELDISGCLISKWTEVAHVSLLSTIWHVLKFPVLMPTLILDLSTTPTFNQTECQ